MSVSARLRSVGVLAAVWLLSGCYYGQVIHGQMSLLADRQPIDQVLAELEPSAPLYQQLQVARDARRFAVTELRLPDNASYTGYVAQEFIPTWEDKIAALRDLGVEVSGRVELVAGLNGDNEAYMTAKVNRLGHLVGHPEAQ